MSMRSGALVLIIICLLMGITTYAPASMQRGFAGLLSLLLAATIVFCIASRWRYLSGSYNSRKVAYILMHFGFIFLVAAGIAGSWGKEFSLELHQKQLIDLSAYGFKLDMRVDEIRAEYYSGGLPRQYFTTLSFQEESETVNTQTVSVNHPASYRGLYFYQSGYSNNGGQVSILKVKSKPDRPFFGIGAVLLSSGVLLWLYRKGKLV